MDELTITCTVRRRTTLLAVEGDLEDDRCESLREALEMSRMFRDRGPIVVDLADAGRLSPTAVRVLHDASEEARAVGRSLTVRTTRPGKTANR